MRSLDRSCCAGDLYDVIVVFSRYDQSCCAGDFYNAIDGLCHGMIAFVVLDDLMIAEACSED
jgi:hypothetical protein